ncbi:MAG: hypothetical protein A2Y12_12080 [Planctomycetes bacterium GWF2_42_9]|nr:MAG: hypothetical protein A2Y12_12080 [Planctomycetes bacterium GWF2_42_9]
MKFNNGVVLKFPDISNSKYQLNIKPNGAYVEAVDSDGNPVLTKFKFGKGTVFFLNAGLESLLGLQYGAFDESSPDYASIYKLVGGEVIHKNCVIRKNDLRSILLTEHTCNDGGTLVVGVNHSSELIEGSLEYDNKKFAARILYGNCVDKNGLLNVNLESGTGLLAKLMPR